MTKIIGIIPARYGSTRLPAKALIPILGKSLIQRTYENALRCSSLKSIVVATDDQRIFDHVIGFGGEAVMTSQNCLTGTDRLAEAVRTYDRFDGADIIINIQGDEPIADPKIIDTVADLLVADPSVPMSTAIKKIDCEEDAHSCTVNKCIIDNKGFAIYFSRGLIPRGKQGYRPEITYYKHIGIYGYRRDFLLTYASLPPTPLQLAEDLEQLKAIEHGYKIKTAVVQGVCVGVDTPEDIKKVEEILCRQNLSLLPEEYALR